jgi:PKD repeat protein
MTIRAGHRRSPRRILKTSSSRIAASAVAASLTLLLLAAAASAAPTTDVAVNPIASGSQSLGGYDINGVEPVTGTVFNLHATAHATWSGSLTTAVGWDTNKVRQGAQLDVSRVAPLTAGHVDVSWVITGSFSPFGLGDIGIGPVPLSKDNVACAPKLSGSGYTCTATSDAFSLVDTPGIPASPYVDMVLEAQFDITPAGAIVGRDFKVNDIAGAPFAGSLSLTDSSQSETFSMPCNAPVGSPVQYSLSPFDWTPATNATQQPHFQIGVRDPGYALGFTKLPPFFDAPFGSAIQTTPAFDLNGSGHTTDMGTLLANNVAPTIDPIADFAGDEGSPISFSASTHSQCPISSYVWEFSNGTKSFGPSPKRTFADNGSYDGQLTVTDETGLSATRSFTVNVANVPPSVNAGPDTTADWGRIVAFNGQATDPGANDQATLQYSWDFGDGSPSASGGPSVLHSYSAPGTYTATLTVCDKDENPATCPTDSRDVHVTKRDTTTAYLGDTTGVFDTAASLSASLVDEYGQNVNARTVKFTVGSDPSLNGLTNSSGVATKAYTPGLAAGAYTASSEFSGDSLYNASSSSNGFTVAKKATTTAYTGAVTGGPNKTVTLSAVLKDATGKPLAGRTTKFQLGTQIVSAVTDANGAAAAPLKLAQKNGSYTVSATYTPAAGDVPLYIGSSQGVVFKLQAK